MADQFNLQARKITGVFTPNLQGVAWILDRGDKIRHKNRVPQELPTGVRIRYHHWYFRMPWMKAYRGMVWGRTILFRQGPADVPPALLKHELVHIEQINRYGVVGFYTRYVAIYFRNLWHYRSFWKAYFEHPFEIEARQKSE